MGSLMEAQLGRLGSRWSLNFRPRERRVWASPLGRFLDRPFALRVAVADADQLVGLPFDPDVTPAPTLRQYLRPASICFEAPQAAHGWDLRVTCTAPFYPRDERISTVPAFLLDVHVRRTTGLTMPPRPGVALHVALLPLTSGRTVADERCTLFHTGFGRAPDYPVGFDQDDERTIEATVGLWALPARSPNGDGVFEIPLDGAGDSLTASFALIGHCTEPVLTVGEEPQRFVYLQRFPSVSAVADFLEREEVRVRARTAFFEQCFTASSLDPAAVSLVSQGWQGYLTNTWWTASPDGERRRLTVWEGNCLFHSTVDVEFHNAIALLQLWPDLLRDQVRAWAAAVGEDGVVPHDLGSGLRVADRATYPHAMPVEECCNLLLLLFALWRFCDDWDIVREHLSVVRKVYDALCGFDADADGFHESGTANTIDDGGPAVQFAPKQTYLAIKALAAVEGVAAMADEAGDEAWAEQCRARAAAARATLEGRAWDGAGYRVSLLHERDAAHDPWSNAPYPGPLYDAAARSPWTTLGLLYPALIDMLPDIDPDRIRDDLATALAACAGPWGSRHSSAEPEKGWISQNIARDIVAAYFGIDLLGQAGRYWAFEQAQNADGPGGAFVDTIGPNRLSYYPRGAVAVGLLAAVVGLRLDRAGERLTLSPPRLPARAPLLPLADWESGRVPWVTLRLVNGKLQAEVTHEDLLRTVGDVNVELGPALDALSPEPPASQCP